MAFAELPVVALMATEPPVSAQIITIEGPVAIGFAATTGALYALAAFSTALAATRVAEGAEGWEKKHQTWGEVFSVMCMATGGALITGAYGSGYPIAFLQSIYCSVQLGFNMLLCIYFSLSDFTKAMMVGNIFFAGCTIMLGPVVPDPKDVPLDAVWTAGSLAFNLGWWSLWLVSICSLRALSDKEPRHAGKVWAWSMAVAGVGLLTDNWGRVMGTPEVGNHPFLWYVLAGFLFIPAALIAYMSVRAFAACDVAVFVPTTLSIQLVGNVIGGYFLWGDGSEVKDHTYFLGYALILLAVYISSPEMDLVAQLVKATEIGSGKLSNGVGKTNFGKAILRMVAAFGDLRQGTPQSQDPSSPKADATDKAKDTFKEALKIGFEGGHVRGEDLIDLSAHLWAKRGTVQGADDIGEWLAGRQYFQDYLRKDPDFKNTLTGMASRSSIQSGGPRTVEMENRATP